MKKKLIIAISILIVVIVAIFLVARFTKKSKAVASYNTATVKYGNIIHSVSATGTVQPISEVQVGTQVSGVIKKIYVDFNSVVRKGQLIAEIDKTNLQAMVDQAKVNLYSSQNDYDFQLKNFNRSKLLYSQKSISIADNEKAEYQLNTAKANLDKAKYDLTKAEINLGYASICSPIDGVILSRAVDEGQTVAASFNTPTLFTIANDLSKMQVLANIDEADIGQVKTGQEVSFTVDAYPDDIFKGIVTQVRLEPITTSNVVTYKVVIEAPNPEFKLMPGLTATITVYTFKKENILILPVQAFNFEPTANTTTVTSKTRKSKNDENTRKAAAKKDTVAGKTVWVKTRNGMHLVQVTTGVSDAISIEILSGLHENDEVVLSLIETTTTKVKSAAGTSGSGTTNPFMPKRPGSNKTQTKTR